MKAKGNIKTCSKCKVDKDISEYYKNKNESDGLQTQCKECVSLSRNNKKPYQGTLLEFNKTKIKSPETENTKYCHECDTIKDLKDFHYYKKTETYNTICKDCKHIISRIQRYKITKEEYIRLLSKSNEKCAICGNNCLTGKSLAVDHDHKTGIVRGFLCQKCNIGIGHLNDDIKLLNSAINYLEEFQTPKIIDYTHLDLFTT